MILPIVEGEEQRDIYYFGVIHRYPTTEYETQMYLMLKLFNYGLKLRLTRSPHDLIEILLRPPRRSVVLWHFDLTRFTSSRASPLSPIIQYLLLLLFKVLKNHLVIFYHGSLIFNIRRVRGYVPLKILEVVYLFVNGLLFRYIIAKIADLIIVYNSHDKIYIKRSLLLPHGVPLVRCSVISSASNGKRIVYFGSVTPRKPLHLILPQIARRLASGYEFYILTNLKRCNPYLHHVVRKMSENVSMWDRFFLLNLEPSDITTRCAYLRGSMVIIPLCADLTPAYTAYEALAFNPAQVVLINVCASRSPDGIRRISMYRIAKLMFEKILNFENSSYLSAG